MTAINVSSVSKSFEAGKSVLEDVSFQIEAGEMVALIGASGSGKSTLIRMISGLETIDKGEDSAIALFGQDVQRNGRRLPAGRAMRREIGVIFQQFNLVGRLSLLNNVLVGRLGHIPKWRGNFGLFGAAEKIGALRALERVGMVDFAHRRASRLSGGQQQRGAIARVLTQQARLILADEPIASLDPKSADTVMETLSIINREDKATVIVSLHQIDHAFRHCKRIIALRKGKLVYDGPTHGIDKGDLAALYDNEADTDFVPSNKKPRDLSSFGKKACRTERSRSGGRISKES